MGDANDRKQVQVPDVLPPRIAVPANGRYVIVTESGSFYELDFDERTLCRFPGEETPLDPEVAPASRLRRDGEVLKVLAVRQLEVGRRAHFDIEPLGEGAWWTRRSTTIVISITAVE